MLFTRDLPRHATHGEYGIRYVLKIIRKLRILSLMMMFATSKIQLYRSMI